MFGVISDDGETSGFIVSELADYGPEDLFAVTEGVIDLIEKKSLTFEIISYDLVDINDRSAYLLEADHISGAGKSMRTFILTVAASGNIYYMSLSQKSG